MSCTSPTRGRSSRWRCRPGGWDPSFFDQLDDARGVPLAPAFVVRNPHDDARMIAPAFDQRFELGLELLRGLRRAGDVGIAVRQMYLSPLGMSCQTSRPSLSHQ